MFTPHFRELRKKQQVTTQSLEKIEDGECQDSPLHAAHWDAK